MGMIWGGCRGGGISMSIIPLSDFSSSLIFLFFEFEFPFGMVLKNKILSFPEWGGASAGLTSFHLFFFL